MLIYKNGKVIVIDDREDTYNNITARKPLLQLKDENNNYAVKDEIYKVITHSIRDGYDDYRFITIRRLVRRI